MKKLTGTVATQIVLEGKRYGRGVVVLPELRRGRKRYARLLCDCGETYEQLITSLVKMPEPERTEGRHCRCAVRKALSRAHKSPEGLERLRAQARSPKTRKATATANKQRLTTHGLSRSHYLYSTWSGIMSRCYNENQRAYANYGGRGITVWPPWHDAARFITDVEAEIGPKPEPRKQYSLDRQDNDGNYEPGNLRWATRQAQVLNRRPDKGSLAEKRIAELEAEVAGLKAELQRAQSIVTEYRAEDMKG